MRRIQDDEMELAAALMADRFAAHPYFVARFAGLPARDCLLAEMGVRLPALAQCGDLLVPDAGPEGLLAGVQAADFGPMAAHLMEKRAQQAVLHRLPRPARERFRAQVRRLLPVSDVDWPRALFGRRYYALHYLTVDASLQGSGMCRALLQPVLEGCGAACLPVVLSAYTVQTVALAEHFGFRLAMTHSLPDLTQYGMVWEAQGSGGHRAGWVTG